MVKKLINLRNDQYRSIKKLSHDNESEFIRVAIDRYVEELIREKLNVSTSLSKGDKHGKSIN